MPRIPIQYNIIIHYIIALYVSTRFGKNCANTEYKLYYTLHVSTQLKHTCALLQSAPRIVIHRNPAAAYTERLILLITFNIIIIDNDCATCGAYGFYYIYIIIFSSVIYSLRIDLYKIICAAHHPLQLQQSTYNIIIWRVQYS